MTSCSTSYARIWGLDFVKPADTNCNDSSSTSCDRGIGGIPGLQLPPPQPTGTFVANVTPSATDATLNNVVIPGLAINETPACATGGSPAQDTYVAGAMHSSVSNFTAGSFSLLSTVGQTNPSGPGARSLTTGVAAPTTPTMIDSWASVVE